MSAHENTRLPSYVRLWLLAQDRADEQGHAWFNRGELTKTLGLDSRDVSRAIRSAESKALLDTRSSARCLVLR